MKKGFKTSIISICNQKGGVGKTGAAANLGASFANLGLKTLIIDLDYQANLSARFGFKLLAKKERKSISVALLENKTLSDVVYHTQDPNLDIIAADMGLIKILKQKALEPGFVFALKNFLEKYGKSYDIIILDNRPSLDLLFEMSMTAAHYYLLPMFPEADPFDGVEIIFDEVHKIKESSLNPQLFFLGILITRHDPKHPTHKKFLPLIKEFAEGNKIKIRGVIQNTTAEAGSSSSQKPLIWYKPTLEVTKTYLQIAENLLPDLRGPREGRAQGVHAKNIQTPDAIINLFEKEEAEGVMEL